MMLFKTLIGASMARRKANHASKLSREFVQAAAASLYPCVVVGCAAAGLTCMIVVAKRLCAATRPYDTSAVRM